jgi:spore coat protein U-like protein
MMRAWNWLVFIAAMAAPGLSRADCNNLRFSSFDGYHDFRQEPRPTIELRVRANDGCEFFATIDNGGASSYQNRVLRRFFGFGGELPVSICLDAACTRHWKQIPEATSQADVLAGAFTGNGGETVIRYYPRLGTNEYPPYGDYDAIFTVRLYEGSVEGARALRDIDSVRFSARVEKRIDVSLVSTGFPFDSGATNKTLDFGLLSPGKEMGFDVLLKYNAGYRLRLASENNGVMKHVSGDSTLPYTLSLNNAPISLANSRGGGVEVSTGAGLSPAAGLRFPGRVRIGSFTNARAGSYEDRLTLTVSTNE